VRREDLEASILGPVRKELLSPARVAITAKEMQSYHAERLRAMQTRAAEVPKELQELTARIERLRERLRKGDPDMPPDELQAAIERAEQKRQELEAQQPSARASAKVLSVLPRAAEMFRRQVEQGSDGDERAALKARVFLRELLGRINLKPKGEGELWAEYGMQPTALLKVVGYSGSGGPLRAVTEMRECSLRIRGRG
jgi:DNA repair exonuclease SbcCD ATPase subunit